MNSMLQTRFNGAHPQLAKLPEPEQQAIFAESMAIRQAPIALRTRPAPARGVAATATAAKPAAPARPRSTTTKASESPAPPTESPASPRPRTQSKPDTAWIIPFCIVLAAALVFFVWQVQQYA
jgi:hypothetical protein